MGCTSSKSRQRKTGAMDSDKTAVMYQGVAFPLTVSTETLAAMPKFPIRDDDIVVVSYPKTGTNWLVEIVSKVLRASGKTTEGSSDNAEVGPIEQLLPPATQPGYLRLAEMPSPRLVITHLPIQLAPQGISKPQAKVKVLVPMRNQKDTAVSLFHFANKMLQVLNTEEVLPWDVFVREFMSGKVYYGDYLDHLLGWWQMRDDPHFLFLKYEDMKKDLLSAVKTIAAFLEVDLDEATIRGIAEACTFDNMSADLQKKEAPHRQFAVRKGVVGDWKNIFSQEESEAFDAWYEKKLSGTGITFDFE